MARKDYIIFDKAPSITFTCNQSIHDWYVNNTEESERPKISGTITTSDCASDFVISNAAAEIKVRGNYTANYSKKPFQIKFDKKQNLFGLNRYSQHKKWILLAEYNDSSMLRNALAFYLGKHLLKGIAWAPTFTFVHFYIRDTEQLYYMGLYLLCDQKEQAKKRVDVFEPEDGYEGTDIGYFFERDDYYETSGDPTFVLNDPDYVPSPPYRTGHESNRWARQAHDVHFSWDGYSIKSKITNESQIAFLKDRLLKIYEILYRAAYDDALYELDENGELVLSSETDPFTALNKTIDVNSFVSMYLLNEIVCNPDIGHSSFYLSLDMSEEGNKLLTLCCPWDYDLAIGITMNFAARPERARLWAKECTLNPWLNLLNKTSWFKALVDAKWQEIYNKGLLYNSFALLDDYSTNYQLEFAKNFEEWNINFGENRTWNCAPEGKTPLNFIAPTYASASSEADCEALLKDWLNRRYVVLHDLLNGEGSINWPAPPQPHPYPNNNRALICVKENNKLVLKPLNIYGMVHAVIGEGALPNTVARLVYDLKTQTHKNSIKVELCTGGEYIDELGGYKSWFPGSTTYGFNRVADISVYADKACTQPLLDNNDNPVVIPMWGNSVSREEATFIILSILDAVNTDPEWTARLRIKYHIRTHDGYEGYISAQNLIDIYYKVAE